VFHDTSFAERLSRIRDVIRALTRVMIFGRKNPLLFADDEFTCVGANGHVAVFDERRPSMIST
jgi:hypothetical protein